MHKMLNDYLAKCKAKNQCHSSINNLLYLVSNLSSSIDSSNHFQKKEHSILRIIIFFRIFRHTIFSNKLHMRYLKIKIENLHKK